METFSSYRHVLQIYWFFSIIASLDRCDGTLPRHAVPGHCSFTARSACTLRLRQGAYASTLLSALRLRGGSSGYEDGIRSSPSPAAERSLGRFASSDQEARLPEGSPLRIFCGTWNVNGKPVAVPLEDWLIPPKPVDLYLIGLQEVQDLKMQNALITDEEKGRLWVKAVQLAVGASGREYRCSISSHACSISRSYSDVDTGTFPGVSWHGRWLACIFASWCGLISTSVTSPLLRLAPAS